MSDLFEENKKLNEQEYQERKTILRSHPRELMTVLTTRCNLQCIMCAREISGKLFPEEFIPKLVELFPYMEDVNWQGGEVFLVPYFEKLIALGSEHPHLHQNITTNGILITSRWAESLARARVAVALSIDGVTKTTYEHIRVHAKFERLCENLDLLNEAYDRHGVKDRWHLLATVMSSNYHELELFLEFAKKYRFSKISFKPILFQTDHENFFHHKNEVVLTRLSNMKPKIIQKGREYGVDVNWLLPAASSDSANGGETPNPGCDVLCRKPWKSIHVDVVRQGNVYPHCGCAIPAGNMFTDSIQHIWNGPIMQEYRKRMAWNNIRGFCSDPCVSGEIHPSILQ